MVKIIGDNEKKFEKSRKFQQWLNRFNDKSAKIMTIEEGWSLWKGKNQDELVFALLFVECLDEEGRKRGDVVFFRSDASAVFLIIKDKNTGKKYVALIEQLRIASGGKLLEIPAGSVEDEDSFGETIVREVAEEVGVWPHANSYNLLGIYYFSPGACNERISLYSCEFSLVGEEIKRLQGKLTGTPGEHTKVKLYPLEDFGRLPIKDAKTILAYLLYVREKSNNGG